jgi:CRISPR-associated protein Csx3
MTAQAKSLSSVNLDVIELDFADCTYQTLVINLSQPNKLIQPSILQQLELPPTLDLSREVILFGQAPVWLYGYLIQCCHSAPWIGCYNAPLGEVVIVHSQPPQTNIGDTIAPQLNIGQGAAILIGGPPDSGKSLLSNALRQALSHISPSARLYLHRANWDGQGNWTYEMPDTALSDQLVLGFDAKLHWHPEAAQLVPKYFRDQAEAVQNLRKVRDLVLVDVGGVPQVEKQPIVQACSHYLVISSNPDVIDDWHSLCAPTLQCLAVIHSKADVEPVCWSSSPLKLVVGLKEIAETGTLPPILINLVAQLIKDRRN